MFTTANSRTYSGIAIPRRLTTRQKKFMSELPKNNFVVTTAMKKSGYSDLVATKRQDIVMKSPSIKKAMEALGITNEYISKEYRKITDQDKDLTNKRLSLERSAEFINPELAQNKGFNGQTNNTINVFGADALAKMGELQAELNRLDAVKHDAIEGEVEYTA